MEPAVKFETALKITKDFRAVREENGVSFRAGVDWAAADAASRQPSKEAAMQAILYVFGDYEVKDGWAVRL
jgi:hypothetical protein